MVQIVQKVLGGFFVIFVLFYIFPVSEVEGICLAPCVGGCPAGEVCHVAGPCVSFCIPGGGGSCSGPNDCQGGCCNGGTCGECSCDIPVTCPAGTTPDWSNPSQGCAPWESNGGKICGNGIRAGGTASCDYLCGCPGPDCGRPCKFRSVQYATCVPNCNTTAPTGISATRTSVSSATINWTPGTGGSTQRIYIGANKTEVESNCPGISSPSCVVADTSLTSSQSSFSTGSVLVAGTVYYIRIVNYESSSCSSNSTTATYMSSCTISPSALTLEMGGSAQTLTTSVNSSGEITQVTYLSDDSGIATASSPDSSYPFTSTVNPVSLGTTSITSDVYFGAVLACSDTSAVTVINPDPWWQVQDADVSSNGNITSAVPTGDYFGLPGAGGYPGIPAYGGATDLTEDNVSSEQWIVQSPTNSTKVYDYNFFASQIPSNVTFNSVNPADVAGSLNTPGGEFFGYEWFKYEGPGDLNVDSNVDFGSRKVILLVENANLVINAQINLTDGQGFFMAAVDGNTAINPSLGGATPALEGVYISDGSFTTGPGTTQLYIRGLVAAYGGVSLQRDLEDLNQTTPSEFFEYAADQVLLFPSKISLKKINWKEVAP